MATYRRKRKISRLTVARIEVGLLFTFLISIGFLSGKLYAKLISKSEVEVVTETKTIVQRIGVPIYKVASPPEKSEVHYFDIPLSHSLQDYIYEICNDEEVPVTLVLALIEHESKFNPDTVSSTDDYGLMQINACNHEYLEKAYRTSDYLDPYQNVFCGTKIIGKLIRKYEGDYHKALMAYNMGEAGARKCWHEGKYTSKYSRAIMELKAEYEEELNEQ